MENVKRARVCDSFCFLYTSTLLSCHVAHLSNGKDARWFWARAGFPKKYLLWPKPIPLYNYLYFLI
jgi:hypothetical protein